MKRIFFPKSASRREKKPQPAQLHQKAVDSEQRCKSESFVSVSDRQITEMKTIPRSSVFTIRQTLSTSSAALESGGFDEEDLTESRKRQQFPSSHGECNCSDCRFQSSSRGSKSERYNGGKIKNPPVKASRNHASCSTSNPSSPQNSFGSTSLSEQVLDLYIDDDRPQDKLRKKDHHLKSPAGAHRRVISESNLCIPSNNTSRDSLRHDHEYEHESSRILAKDVVGKLLMLEQSRDLNWPPMPTSVCDKHLDDMSRKGCMLKDFLLETDYGTNFPEENNDVTDFELRRKLEVVKKKALKLSRELAQERSFQFDNVNVSVLPQMIRSLIEEERNLVLELYDHLQCRISERAAAKEESSLLKEEIHSVIMIKEGENGKLQSKLKEFELEENRLKDQLTELTAFNISLQKEISALYDKERDYMDRVSKMEVNLKGVLAKSEETRSENDSLRKMMSDVKEKLKNAEEARFCMEKNMKEKNTENSNLINTVSRVRGICSEHEKTINGLRECLDSGELQNVTHKLQMEQSRLAEVEQGLRKQLETFTVEVTSLRTENIYLLERLKRTGGISGRSALQLDQELESCVQSMKNTGLSLLNESVQTCDTLLKIIGRNGSSQSIPEAHTIIQYAMKVRRFKHGLEQLTRSLRKTCSVLEEKAEATNHKVELAKFDNRRLKTVNRVVKEDDLISELKAESLLTSILKERLYSKETEVERVQAELARALHNHDVLKTEIQDAFDTVSCLNHKMKNFELQMIEKDGTINQIRGEVQSREDELSSTKRTLSKVTQERDLMWEEVKQYSEKNMLLNRELGFLKKKIDALEEDTLLKDGQISILKDSLSNARPFDDVLFGTSHGNLFKL